jgi:hypothetical protein
MADKTIMSARVAKMKQLTLDSVRFVGCLELFAICGEPHATSLRMAALNVSRAL